MTYLIASDEAVTKAIIKVLQQYRIISSQKRFKELVEKELKTNKKEYRVSGSRLRHLALQTGMVSIEIHSREGDPHKIMNKCPVCLHNLQRVKNLTIFGGEVTIELRCLKCGYWTGKKKRIPNLYIFHYEKEK
ncbi:MAG: hypothetical protein R6V50_06130 [Thermoplasmatota archaeon]